MTTKITGTNTAAAPGITGDDTDTGLVYGTDSVSISTGGTTRTTVNSSGHLLPGAADTYDLGANTTPWRNIWMENDLYIEDNGMAVFGTGEDLKIYYDGSHSYIKGNGAACGGIIIDNSADADQNINLYAGQDIYLKTHDGSHTSIRCERGGAVELYYNNSVRFKTESSWCYTYGDSSPANDDSYNLGGGSKRWDNVYATNGYIQTSDKNEKNTIVETDLGLSFVNKLKPVSYKFNNKTRTHYGLVAQDVETTLSDISKPTTGFAGFIKEDIPDQLYVKEDEIPEGKKVGDVKKAAYTTYGLRYNEFISPLIKAVQELSAEVETLKTKVAALEAG